jgi:hypothetical protein
MTLELWLVAGSVVITLFIAGVIMGVFFASVLLDRWHAAQRQKALDEQTEYYKAEMRELAAVNARLELRVSELEAQQKSLFQALELARIPVPKTGPLPQSVNVTNVLAGAGLTTGGDIAGRDKSGG